MPTKNSTLFFTFKVYLITMIITLKIFMRMTPRHRPCTLFLMQASFLRPCLPPKLVALGFRERFNRLLSLVSQGHSCNPTDYIDPLNEWPDLRPCLRLNLCSAFFGPALSTASIFDVCEGVKIVDSHYEIIDMVLAMAFGPRFIVLRAGLHGSRISHIWASAKY